MKFVRRNSDKPHRCPRCHAVMTWYRTRWTLWLSCKKCDVFWFYGRKP